MPNENESIDNNSPISGQSAEDIEDGPMPLLHANVVPGELVPTSGWVLVPVIGTIQPDSKLVLKDGWMGFTRFEANPERQPESPRIPDQDGAAG